MGHQVRYICASMPAMQLLDAACMLLLVWYSRTTLLCPTLDRRDAGHMSRHAFLTNQKVSPPSSWGYKDVDLADAEAAGVDNYASLGCRWAPKGETAAPTSSADSARTTVAVNGTGATSARSGKGSGARLRSCSCSAPLDTSWERA